MAGKYSREIFRNLPREVKDYAWTTIICNSRRLLVSLAKSTLAICKRQVANKASIVIARVRRTRARDLRLSGELLWYAGRLRNRRLSLRREGRITGRHWLPLFAPRVSQCRVSRRNRNNSFTAVLLSNMKYKCRIMRKHFYSYSREEIFCSFN